MIFKEITEIQIPNLIFVSHVRRTHSNGKFITLDCLMIHAFDINETLVISNVIKLTVFLSKISGNRTLLRIEKISQPYHIVKVYTIIGCYKM